jgi:hypothetical protein
MVKRDFKVFVEGGSKGALNVRCRAGFGSFFEKSGLKGKMPKVVACGSRRHAYDDFCVALANAKLGDVIVLLVDSEAPVNCEEDQVWGHVYSREGDKWPRPNGAEPADLHFMVECMEAWFMADKPCLETYFRQGFETDKLPSRSDIEQIAKTDLYEGLKKATKNCRTKTCYSKGPHYFDILGKIDPAKVIAVSPYAKRLIDKLLINA